MKLLGPTLLLLVAAACSDTSTGPKEIYRSGDLVITEETSASNPTGERQIYITIGGERFAWILQRPEGDYNKPAVIGAKNESITPHPKNPEWETLVLSLPFAKDGFGLLMRDSGNHLDTLVIKHPMHEKEFSAYRIDQAGKATLTTPEEKQRLGLIWSILNHDDIPKPAK